LYILKKAFTTPWLRGVGRGLVIGQGLVN